MLLKIVIKSKRHLCFIKTSRRATYIKLVWLELSATLQKSRSETKKALNGPSFFYCEQIKRLVKLPKYHFFQFAKQRKQSCPLIIVIKCTFCIRNRANLQWGQNVSGSREYFLGIKFSYECNFKHIFILMFCVARRSVFFNPLRKCHLTNIKTEISVFGDIN